MYFWLLLWACSTNKNSDLKQPKDNKPVLESDLRSTDPKKQVLENCVSDCVREKQMEARSAESIASDCRASCEGKPSPFPEGGKER